MLLKNFDIEKEEYLNKLKVIGTFAADDLNYKYKLSKYHIYCKYEDEKLYINHLAFMSYSPDLQQSLYLPFIFQKFIVRLGV